MNVSWDPEQYQRYADHRGRPFHELVGRVGASAPAYVVDHGCGPGTLTASLLERWPDATIEGLDSSPEMIAEAGPLAEDGRLSFAVSDVRDWRPERPVDVLISNAMLQWVPDHLDLLQSLVGTLSAEGWIAFQVPNTLGMPSHETLRAVAADPRWKRHLEGPIHRPGVATAEEYLKALHDAGCDHVDVWETTYLQILPGEDPVFEWLKGTGARPYLQALPDDVRPAFEAEFRARLRAVFPAREYGTVLPYRRIFAVGRRSR